MNKHPEQLFSLFRYIVYYPSHTPCPPNIPLAPFYTRINHVWPFRAPCLSIPEAWSGEQRARSVNLFVLLVWSGLQGIQLLLPHNISHDGTQTDNICSPSDSELDKNKTQLSQGTRLGNRLLIGIAVLWAVSVKGNGPIYYQNVIKGFR